MLSGCFNGLVGLPAGYGYSKIPSVEKQDIMPAMKEHFKKYDNHGPIIINSFYMTVDKACNVSINGRAPILIDPTVPFCFNSRGIHSIVFEESGIMYNIVASY